VFGPDAIAAGDEAAVEGGGVVGFHAAVVVGAAGVDEAHLSDRIAQREEPAHRHQHRRGSVAVDDQAPAVDVAVEAPVADGQQAQSVEANGTATVPGNADHALASGGVERRGTAVESQRL
jgi:hypothetical protein